MDNEEENDNQIYSFHGTHKCPNETTFVSKFIIYLNIKENTIATLTLLRP